MYVWFPVFAQDDPRWSDMTILYALWYDAMALAYKLFALFSFASKLILFFYMATMRNAQTKVAIGYIREQYCDTRDDMIPIWYGMYAMEGTDH